MPININKRSDVNSVNGKVGDVVLNASDVGALSKDTKIPTKTSELINDSNYVSDDNYIHTDNNYTNEDKDKLNNIANGAEVNVQSDWAETDDTQDSFIKNKPFIPSKTSELSNDSNFVVDADYKHTDNNYTTADKNSVATIGNKVDKVEGKGLSTNDLTDELKADYDDAVLQAHTHNNKDILDNTTASYTTEEKTKLSGIAAGAQANVQSDWDETTTSAAAFIKNKPTIPSATSQLKNDSDYTTSEFVTNALKSKVDIKEGWDLSENNLTAALITKINNADAKAHTHSNYATLENIEEAYTTAEKNKLKNIAAGAQVNSITGVKGDSETEYRTGNVNITKANVGLGNVDNTTDANKPVSTAQQKAIDAAYANSNKYTDKKIADLINGAPETMDTLKEVSDAINASKSVEEALNKAIGTKANQIELDTHTGNDTIHITATERTNWNDANSKKHSHANKTTLDGITADKVASWNKISNKLNEDGNASNTTVAFKEATTRTNLTTGEKISISFGKIAKWFSDLKTVAFSGSYNDLSNKPTIPTNTNQLTNGAGFITSSGTAKTISDTLPISKGGTGKTTGVDAANTLINSLSTGESTPTDADYYISQYVGGGTTTTSYHRRPMRALWNYIKSKLATVATSGSYNDLSNKPTIPSVGNGTVTITQNGTSKGTFTMNQNGNTTIALTDTNTDTWRPQPDWNATSGDAVIKNKPTLGTAAAKNVASSGNATNSGVVMGNDTRLTNARPASDVAAWAKASTKPSYTKSEIGLGNVDNTADADKSVKNADKLYNKSNDYYGVWLGGMTIPKGTEAGMSQSVTEDPLHRYIKPTSIIDIYYDDNSVQYASEIGMLYNIQESGGIYYLSIAPKKDVVKQDIVIQNILVRNP